MDKENKEYPEELFEILGLDPLPDSSDNSLKSKTPDEVCYALLGPSFPNKLYVLSNNHRYITIPFDTRSKIDIKGMGLLCFPSEKQAEQFLEQNLTPIPLKIQETSFDDIRDEAISQNEIDALLYVNMATNEQAVHYIY